VREICGNLHESSEIVKRRILHIFGQHFEQDYHSLQMADHFALYREDLFVPIFEHSTPLSYSSVTQYIWAVNRA
jgi:hypothetical protein